VSELEDEYVRLSVERELLIIEGVDPDELLIPLYPVSESDDGD
jgi:hypothetical protein